MHYHPRTIPSSEQRDCGSPTVPGTPIIASAQWDIPSQASWEEGRQEEVKWAHRKIRGRILPPAAPGEWRFVQHLRSDGPSANRALKCSPLERVMGTYRALSEFVGTQAR